MNGAHEKRFLRTFNINDRATVHAVETIFLPKLEEERRELHELNNGCIRRGTGRPFDEWIEEIGGLISAVRERLSHA
tara:strand:+ start:1719 stop:1949 length:231 start_codon:yes stop_codon:yes gene_type:complete